MGYGGTICNVVLYTDTMGAKLRLPNHLQIWSLHLTMSSPELLSRRASYIQISPTLAVNEYAAQLKAQGHDVVNLSAGEPDFRTPEHVCEAAARAIKDGKTKYTPVAGTPELRNAVAAKLAQDNRLSYQPSEIIVSTGCKQSLFNAMQAVLDPGDEAIICSPYWTSYPDMVTMAGAQPIYIGSGTEMGFKISPSQLNDCISDNTKLVILNSPSNPTGQAYTAAELEAIAEVIMEHPRLVVISDDIYEHLLWEHPFVNILNVCPDLAERTIVCNGVSKAYAMTGWRIGYAAGPQHMIDGMVCIQSQSTSGACSIAQAAALAALTGTQNAVQENTNILRERHDFMIGRLKQIPGVSCLPSHGTFYLFPDFSEIIARMPETVGVDSDLVLGRSLLSGANVAIVPGNAFGAPGYARLSFATDMKSLQTAMDRLEQYLSHIME